MKVKNYYLLGFLLFLTRIEKNNKIIWKLFNFLPLVTIKQKTSQKTFYYYILKLLAKLPTKRNSILIMDNLFEPNANIQDNFTFFEYLYKSSNYNFNPYYILNKKSPYFPELKSKYKNNIIAWNTESKLCFKLNLLFLMPRLKFIIDSFQSIQVLKLELNQIIKKTKHISSIFTQHGITYFKPDFITPNTYGFNIYDFVTVSNKREKELFIKRGGFPENRIIENGLFRWDKIKDLSKNKNEKSIFIFFTKRDYLTKIRNIEESAYINQILDIINNPVLQKTLNEKNIKIKLGLHHTTANLVKDYFDLSDVELITEDDIYKIKQESSLLLTDYSSMCFEFFLQQKPVIFYDIDDKEDCKYFGTKCDIVNPYQDKNDELFNTTTTSKEVVDLIINYVNNDFECSKEIIDIQNKHFYFKNDFCKRFEEYLILNKIKK